MNCWIGQEKDTNSIDGWSRTLDMESDDFDLDETDRAILYLLQENARNNTTTEIGEQVGVSATTIGNRISRMEEQGIIEGYQPIIDYEKIGLQLHPLFVCEVPTDERPDRAEQAMDVPGTITVQEVLTGANNFLIEALAPKASKLTTITTELEALGIDVKETEILGPAHLQPFDHFGSDFVADE